VVDVLFVEALRPIPVVVTTSKAEEDIAKAYDSYANGYSTTPIEFSNLADPVRATWQLWLCAVTLLPEKK